jgi:hypothetical protein
MVPLLIYCLVFQLNTEERPNFMTCQRFCGTWKFSEHQQKAIQQKTTWRPGIVGGRTWLFLQKKKQRGAGWGRNNPQFAALFPAYTGGLQEKCFSLKGKNLFLSLLGSRG